jgi:transposase
MAESRQTKRRFLRLQGTLNPRPQGVRHESFQDSEFFDPEDLLQVKYEMLRQVEIDQQPVSQAAKAFGFSRPAFYQAQAAFQDSGLAGLLPRKRGPHAGHKLTAERVHFVTELRLSEPGLSSSQLAERVRERFGVSIHPRSIDRQLRRQKKLRR